MNRLRQRTLALPLLVLAMLAAVLTAGIAEAGDISAARRMAFGLQLVVNGVALGCVYGLLALGYTLVFSLIGRINLAFGHVAMIGAYATSLGSLVLAAYYPVPVVIGWALLMVATFGLGGAYGLAIDRLIFRPLRDASSQAPLVATLGLAIALEEAVRLLQGGREHWIEPVEGAPRTMVELAGFAVMLAPTQLVVIGITLAIYAILLLVMQRSRFGRTVRACTDDLGMAALCGVNVDRTVGLVLMLSTALAGFAGCILMLRYGGIGFYDGFVFSFKALTAAVVGGIGSVPGAMLGGFVIGLAEVFWDAYLVPGYREVAIFSLLAMTLVLRPNGLLGPPASPR